MAATAYLGIFETKLEKLREDIKKLKKEQPENKDRLKMLANDAKSLYKVIKSMKKEPEQEYEILVTPEGHSASHDRIKILSSRLREDGTVEIKFKLRQSK